MLAKWSWMRAGRGSTASHTHQPKIFSVVATEVVSVTEGSGAGTPYSGFAGVCGRMDKSSKQMRKKVGYRGLTMLAVVR